MYLPEVSVSYIDTLTSGVIQVSPPKWGCLLPLTHSLWVFGACLSLTRHPHFGGDTGVIPVSRPKWGCLVRLRHAPKTQRLWVNGRFNFNKRESHFWMSHVPRAIESCHAWEYSMSRMSHVTRKNTACLIWVMSHLRIHQVANESRHT